MVEVCSLLSLAVTTNFHKVTQFIRVCMLSHFNCGEYSGLEINCLQGDSALSGTHKTAVSHKGCIHIRGCYDE